MHGTKRRLPALSVIVICALFLCACSGREISTSSGTETNVTSKTDDILQEIPAEAVTRYFFRSGEAVLYPDLDVTSFPVSGEEQTGYFEAESCAALGMDKTYLFRDFEVTTYPDGDRDLISYIFLKTDAVSTPEGIDLSMDIHAVRTCYGTETADTGNALIYEKGGMRLLFFYQEDGHLTSIEYRSGAAE